jgi:putative flippase GtrA
MRPGRVERSSGIVERHRPLMTVALRFLVGGALNTGATLLLYWLLMRFMHYQWAYLASYCAGILLSYVLNTRFVFRTSHNWLKLMLFPLVYLVTYAVGALVLTLAVNHLHVPASLGPLASIVATLPVSFLLTRMVLHLRERPEA